MATRAWGRHRALTRIGNLTSVSWTLNMAILWCDVLSCLGFGLWWRMCSIVGKSRSDTSSICAIELAQGKIYFLVQFWPVICALLIFGSCVLAWTFWSVVSGSGHRVVGRIAVLSVAVVCCFVFVRLVICLVAFWFTPIRRARLWTSNQVVTFVSLFVNENMVDWDLSTLKVLTEVLGYWIPSCNIWVHVGMPVMSWYPVDFLYGM